MSGGRDSEATAIVALALALHRTPARHAELLHGNAPLPAAVTVLLRLAGGTAPRELDPALVALGPEHEMRAAALFFIEQVLFRHDASHYRVLGLNRDAAPEQIKEHHRLLMRLFHPDRDSRLGERQEQFATRANLAYNTLRDADMRARYDDTLKPLHAAPAPAPARAPRRAAPVVRRRMPQPESFWAVRVQPLFMRYLPQWVLAGTALVSVTMVGTIYLLNQPLHLPVAASSRPAVLVEKPASPPTHEVVEIAAAEATRLDEVVAQFEHRLGAAGQTFAAAPANDETASTPVQPVAPPPLPVRAISPAIPAKAVQAEPVQPARKPVLAAPPPVPAVAAAELARPVAAVAVTAPPPASEPSPPLPDPNSLLSRFLEAYERGDMQTCMALLDEGLRTDTGGKPELRREFDVLFRATDLRHIKILNMNWSREGDTIRGEGQYRATLMRKGETLLRIQGGQIHVELVRRGGTALINELYYVANGKS